MKNSSIKDLEPSVVWRHFAAINAVPRASKKEEKIIEFMVDFGKSLNLETVVDPVGNVIIKKDATPGMENRKTVVMQAHLDMVHQKNADTDFNFDTEGISMWVDGDWVKARGTTLGADNGLGVAAIMGVLSSSDLIHPNLEALFTIDEETGMTGAKGLQPGFLKGDILLNLDTEEDDEIDIGCAGGVDVSATGTYSTKEVDRKDLFFQLSVTGLKGGHSGMDIHLGRGNANKIMNSVLEAIAPLVSIGKIDGGGLRNAIPRESFAWISCSNEDEAEMQQQFATIKKALISGFVDTDPEIQIGIETCEPLASIMDKEDQKKLLHALEYALNGVYKMSEEMPDLVEASNNIARVIVKDGEIAIKCLTRSSSESSKAEVVEELKTNFESHGYHIELSGDYPGWQPNPDSEILEVLKKLYVELFKDQPRVVACHAGLECGILGTHYPNLDMISFGPTIQGAHSPDERASISSTERFWNYLKKILEEIPTK